MTATSHTVSEYGTYLLRNVGALLLGLSVLFLLASPAIVTFWLFPSEREAPTMILFAYPSGLVGWVITLLLYRTRYVLTGTPTSRFWFWSMIVASLFAWCMTVECIVGFPALPYAATAVTGVMGLVFFLGNGYLTFVERKIETRRLAISRQRYEVNEAGSATERDLARYDRAIARMTGILERYEYRPD